MKFFTVRNIVLILFILFVLASTIILEPLSLEPKNVVSQKLLLKQPLFGDDKNVKYMVHNQAQYDIEYKDEPWSKNGDGGSEVLGRLKNDIIKPDYYCMDHYKKGVKGTCYNPPKYGKSCRSLTSPDERSREIDCPSGWKIKAIIGKANNGAETQTQRCSCKYKVVPGDKQKSIDNLWKKCMSKWPEDLQYGVYKKDINGRELRVNEVSLSDSGKLWGVLKYPAEWPADGGGKGQPWYGHYGPWGWLNTYNKYEKVTDTGFSGWKCTDQVKSINSTNVYGRVKIL